MTNYMIPTDKDLIEDIAKSLARERLIIDLQDSLQAKIGNGFDLTPQIENSVDLILDHLWAGGTPEDEQQRRLYRSYAKVAIQTINLKLLTTTM